MPSEERKPTEGQRVCPKCGGEVFTKETNARRWNRNSRSEPSVSECGHEEKVR